MRSAMLQINEYDDNYELLSYALQSTMWHWTWWLWKSSLSFYMIRTVVTASTQR